MGRNKINRECFFKPKFTLFTPSSGAENGKMELNSDEMEAIFLMDYQLLYQEDAALQMSVSRPTFSRIIKSARQKIATALVHGYALSLNENKDKFIVAFPVGNKEVFNALSNTETFIAFVHVSNQKVIDIHFLNNPLHGNKEKQSLVLPEFLKAHEVTYWLSSSIGESLKNALLAKGIFYKKVSTLGSAEEIPQLFCKYFNAK